LPLLIEMGTVSLAAISRYVRLKMKLLHQYSRRHALHGGPILRETRQSRCGGTYNRLVSRIRYGSLQKFSQLFYDPYCTYSPNFI